MTLPDRFSLRGATIFGIEALRRRWASLLVVGLICGAIAIGIDVLDGPDLPDGVAAPPTILALQIAMDLVWALTAGVAIVLALGGARGRPLDLKGVGRNTAAALPLVLLATMVMDTPTWVVAFWPSLKAGLPDLPYSTLWYLVMTALLGLTLPVGLDRSPFPTDAVRAGWALLRGRRWLMVGLILLMSFCLLLITGLVYVLMLATGTQDHWASEGVGAVFQILNNLMLVGLYLEFDRLHGQGAAGVAAAFD
ncbi:hypothetical protein GVN21_06465 [Caulobacter sp. SLTY]|uniref:hypothetical protein n=1 Tax=Caulobacter sp. SLTY TaxID=2683262 RepID=UPI001412A35F|nr:hypothetical protein [Caulobacter sp. SLTY]NBB14995.1 hypothetical protein [Caulobacter sp. SLTY]